MFLFDCSEMTFANMLIRIFVSLLLGMVIGLNRESKKRVAGIKTNTIVCMGAALVMMTSQYLNTLYPGQSDIARMGAQVISGVGFLGVGTIIVSGRQVRGLTTAASLWACACIGIAVGIGFVDVSVLVTICMLIIFTIFPRIERMLDKNSHYVTVYVEMKSKMTIREIADKLESEGIQIESVDYLANRPKNAPLAAQFVLHLPYAASQFNISKLLEIEDIIQADLI